MAVVKLTYQQEELVFNSARRCGFQNFEVDANIGSFKGDNYLGVITTIAVKEKDEGKVLHLILKSAHTNENFRREAPISKAFEREAYIYNTIVPRIFNFQEEKGISDPFTGAAKFYGSCLEDKNESILLENLKENGYSLWNRKVPMDDLHVSLIFSEYARFHAASLALRHLYPEEFKDLTQSMQLSCFESEILGTEKMNGFIDINFKNGLVGAEGNVKATKALERLRENIKAFFSEDRSNPDQSKQVVIHGDCWCNNFLFKYEDNTSIPTKVCLIDWQISKMGSPALDLSYFFSVNCSKEVLQQLTKYLNIYHKVLSQNLREFGCDPDKIFSFDVLMDEWRKYSKMGVFLALMVLKITLCDSEDVPDVADSLDKGNNIVEAFQSKMAPTSEYNSRLCELVEFMSDNNYI